MKLRIMNPIDFCDDLKNANIPFKLISTTLTRTIIISEKEIYFYSESKKLRTVELNLIKSVKDYCTSLNKKIKLNRDSISYIKVNNFNNGIYKKDVFEIDLVAAYWNIAYNHKFISREIYLRGLNLDENEKPIKPLKNKYGNIYNYVSKTGRLIALGNLAKSKTEFIFNGKQFFKPKKIFSEDTQNFFFKVSKEVDAIMKMLIIIAGESYLFYWVDAIYVKSEYAKDLICDYITNELGMSFKVTKIKKLLKTSSYITVWDETNLNDSGDMLPRPYIFKSLKDKQLKQVLDTDLNILISNSNINAKEKI